VIVLCRGETYELDELVDDTSCAQLLGDGEDEIGGGAVGGELADESVADDLGQDLL